MTICRDGRKRKPENHSDLTSHSLLKIRIYPGRTQEIEDSGIQLL